MANATPNVPAAGLFKAYDIRGVVTTALTPDAVRQIGQSIATLARERGQTAAVIGRDGRESGPALAKALSDGLRAGGLDVVDIGLVATPMLYFATYELGIPTGVMVTGSHNPPEYNGLKMVVAGEAIYGDTITGLRTRIAEGKLATGEGGYRTDDIAERYLQRIVGDVKLSRPIKIVIDAGNGVPGAYAPELFKRLGATVVKELFCEVDGTFPNHHPDPADPHNLEDVMAALRETDAEIGLAFDGDGDRLGVVTKTGNIIWPDRQLMLFARDVLSRNPGQQVIFDVKCSRHVGNVVREAGGVPLLWRTGHSLVKAKLKETGAPLAGEMSGHVFFKERWYGFDDGLYTGARLLEILSKVEDPSAVLEALPNASSTPELKLETAEGENFTLVEKLQQTAKFEGTTEIITIDGVRAEFPDGFGLARPSNTTPVVVLRFEADNPEALERIQAQFRKAILAVAPEVKLPF
ncbi:phosphomannomutase/phosphoglucomutase [Derxia gummosa]|uniref:Phosphomannomutase/phosphoglucomutase n=1 Tax=Derxia gummosa DSM 723 TaxID=1121388 RepID=A0A8B6X1R2_9BURK|nr:phosphomannomutase/phosphoglucomutase [Derxia gummosa]